MAKRFNWQIGREIDYPYEAPPPKKQVCYIFDTNKCIACQTCSIACKSAWTSGKGQEQIFYNNVETRPYGGYPMGWDLKLHEQRGAARWRDGVLRTETIFEAVPQERNRTLPPAGGVATMAEGAPNEPPTGHRPTSRDYGAPNLGEDDITGLVEKGLHFAGIHPMWMFYLARICNHCDHPACLAACPRKAVYKREEDGIVLIDQERCRGYQECVKACPYKKTFFNQVSRTSEKCIGCFPRVEQGEVALCVESCIGKIRTHGFLTTQGEPRPDNPLDLVVKLKKLALPLYPQFGTGPNVYYIPPVHVPDEFLVQLFGPNVAQAKAMYRTLRDDRGLLGALLLFGATNRIVDRFAVQGGEVVGWDEAGQEVARVPFTEPTWVREAFDGKHGAWRHNTP